MSDTPATVTPIDAEAEYFADPRKITRIAIPAINGWIEVKDEISIAEERRIFANAVKGSTTTKDGEQRMEYDAEKVSFGTTALYVLDWSIRKKYSTDALKALKPAIYNAIDEAVKAHVDRVKEGNAPTPSASGVSPTSASAA